MIDDTFLEQLRDEAQKLRFEPDEMMTTRIAIRVRGRLAEENAGGVARILALWFRPVVASLAALALVAMVGVGLMERSSEVTPSGLEGMTSTQTVDVSVGGDTFSVE